jgi:predicted DNA-binding ribbon-helix-helix protein
MKSATTLQRKRSISVSGHKTSISLEDEFWNCLREIAEERGEKYVSKLVRDINAERQFANLSSAIRMYVLRHYRDLVDQQDRTIAPINGNSIEAW